MQNASPSVISNRYGKEKNETAGSLIGPSSLCISRVPHYVLRQFRCTGKNTSLYCSKPIDLGLLNGWDRYNNLVTITKNKPMVSQCKRQATQPKQAYGIIIDLFLKGSGLDRSPHSHLAGLPATLLDYPASHSPMHRT